MMKLVIIKHKSRYLYLQSIPVDSREGNRFKWWTK